ncbi:hypothetical protein X975_08893, partial [Stegodyphus mimosarum]
LHKLISIVSLMLNRFLSYAVSAISLLYYFGQPYYC